MRAPLKKHQGRRVARGFWFNFGGQAEIGWAPNEEYICGDEWQAAAEYRLPRLPHPGMLSPAIYRYADSRDSEPESPDGVPGR